MKEQMENQNIDSSQEQEIDLVELVRRMWVNRALILKVTGVCFALGLLIALFSAKAYTAGCDFVPQTSNSSSTSRMSSLAALAGINLNQMDDVKALSPYVYENILNSTAFRKELMQTKLSYEKADRPVSFYEYNTSDEFNKLSFGKILKKYTIGLPFLILNAIRGEQPEPDYSALASDGEGAKIVTLTKEEDRCNRMLSECISMTLDDKNGYLSLTVTMPEAIVAAEMADRVPDDVFGSSPLRKVESAENLGGFQHLLRDLLNAARPGGFSGPDRFRLRHVPPRRYRRCQKFYKLW